MLSACEIFVKEKTDYIVLESSKGLVEVSESGTIDLMNSLTEIRINKGEAKKITLAATDYFYSVTIKY